MFINNTNKSICYRKVLILNVKSFDYTFKHEEATQRVGPEDQSEPLQHVKRTY